MGVPILAPEQHWECPSCDYTDVTHYPGTNPVSRMHPCKGLWGLTAPMVLAGHRAEHRLVEREDYIGTEDVRLDGEGRPTMAIVTMRDDGNDTTVFAPTATAALRE